MDPLPELTLTGGDTRLVTTGLVPVISMKCGSFQIRMAGTGPAMTDVGVPFG
jgi:hypothetical protein